MSQRRLVLVAVTVALLAASAGCAIDVQLGEVAGEGPVNATVVDVVDGDTVDVRTGPGQEETLRLLGVDTPEVRGAVSPDEFEGVPDTQAGRDCLRRVAEAASTALEDRIGDGQVRYQTDALADRRGSYGRLLVYLSQSETDLNLWLIESGYARLYDSTFTRRDAYASAEDEAQAAGVGVWACRTP